MTYSITKLACTIFIMNSVQVAVCDGKDIASSVVSTASTAASTVKDTLSVAAEKAGIDMVKTRASYIACMARCLTSSDKSLCQNSCLIIAQAERIKELEQKLAKSTEVKA